MLEKDIIQPSTSPWASPIVLVRKKDGSHQFCVYYRKLNSVTKKDAYPIPRIDDTLDTLVGSCWFSTLDLVSGYWQVEMSPTDREKTDFCVPDGLFEFKVMPNALWAFKHPSYVPTLNGSIVGWTGMEYLFSVFR